MHIADGVIATEICLAADAAAIGALYIIGKKVDAEDIPKMGMIASALFVASLIHFPLAGTSIHLGLFGLAGIMLGLKSFPAVFTALLFQSLIFQHGGLMTLGLNVFNMSAGAILGWIFWKMLKIPIPLRAFIAGFIGIIIPALLMSLEFELSGYGKGIFYILYIYSLAAAVEGVLSVVIINFFRRVNPSIIGIKNE